MRKGILLIGMVALIAILIFEIAPAQAELGVGLTVGFYSPRFGEVNDALDWVNFFEGTNLGFRSGFAYGLRLNYDFYQNFRIRGEYNTFSSKTSDSSSYTYGPWEETYDGKFELTVRSIICSGIYRFSGIHRFSSDILVSPYVGGGIGLFFTSFSYEEEWKEYYYGWYEWSDRDSDSSGDTSLGLQVLGGVEFSRGSFSLAGEAKYIIARAEPDVEVDLGGLSIAIVAGMKF